MSSQTLVNQLNETKKSIRSLIPAEGEVPTDELLAQATANGLNRDDAVSALNDLLNERVATLTPNGCIRLA